MSEVFINPFTDFGFKKIFGEEASKSILLDFLNSLLPESHKIQDLSFKNTEQLPISGQERKALFDVYCIGEDGQRFIVELQKAKQNFFKERTIYYSSFPIQEQGLRGESWKFDLKAVYCIGILDFVFDDYNDHEDKNQVIHHIQLTNTKTQKVFYKKLTYIYLEMPNFKKQEHELTSQLDKWLYFLRNLEDFDKIPQIFKDEVVFEKAFKVAAYSALSADERKAYEDSINIYRDWKNIIESAAQEAKEEGREEGILIGKRQTAKAMKDIGIPLDVISQSTQLSEKEIDGL